jgi:hypothetical protein
LQGVELGDQGIEGSFDLENEISEKVTTGYFVGVLHSVVTLFSVRV